MKKNKEIKYNHVGRPTNEEKKKYKKKKTLKIIGIISCIFIVVGGILLYINKDNLAISGIMGNSVTNTMKSIQNNPNYKNTLVFKADAYDGKYLYQRYVDTDGNTKLVTYIYKALGFKDTKKYKAKAIKFYYNGNLLPDNKAYAKGAYIRLTKDAYGKALSAIVYAENLKTKKLEYKPIRIVVAKTQPFLGKKYNLSEDELYGLAYLCYKEQGSVRGAIYEAALIANRYELYGIDQGYYDIVEYAAESPWWNNGYDYVYYPGYVSNEIIDAVKGVLVNGYRPMPLYIDEHDCIWCGYDYGWNVDKIVTGGKVITDGDGLLDRSNYKSGKTKIYNFSDSLYTFYIFPTRDSDPFGYTDEAVAKYNYIKKHGYY